MSQSGEHPAIIVGSALAPKRRWEVVESGSDELVVQMVRSEGAMITAVSDEIVDLLGLRPEDLIGRRATECIHPDDEAGGVLAWVTMLGAPGSVGVWVGRYRTGDGGWKWIESENVNRLDDPENPRVETRLRAAPHDFVGVEEELRRREELISRLSEALPVGVFQLDDRRRVILTNDRLGQILGVGSIETTEELAALVADDDQVAIDSCIEAVLRGESVEDIEVRLVPCQAGERGPRAQFCRFSLRALTDANGAVNGAIGCVHDVTDSHVLRQNLELRASTDELTGCLNRAAIDGLLRQLVGMSASSGMAVAFVDLDAFKQVNDTYGHQAGDEVLVATGERLRGAVRACDHVGRVGGDEFLIVCPDVGSKALATRISNRLATALRGTVPTRRGLIELRASIGLAWTAETGCNPDDLVRRADEAMYAAKAGTSTGVLLVGP